MNLKAMSQKTPHHVADIAKHTKPAILFNMRSTHTHLSRLAIMALIIQLMTPWQALHLGMFETGSGESTHAHCPTSTLGQSSAQQAMNHHGDAGAPLGNHGLDPDISPESFSDTCERACGLTLSDAVLYALNPTTSGSAVIHTRDALFNPLFLKVPNPPPIA